MADLNEATQIILDHFEVVKNSSLNPGSKGTIYLRLAEAYAWITFPNQPHGGNVQVSS